ncbi:patatin-like phospholipase family protein [Ramlibacter cellulosilyticus]|uniref:patatin-like phospholipase family protein n=1 Tax=Ramlibacter cellulosilyticus TaxID=2764187 RepID=UPI001C9AD0E4|nr:patatin-like phospholipase family protein [Ramlibacter cellulosilyticus]
MTSSIEQLAAARRGELSPAQQAGLQQPLWGLALSGGGIRSATFCLGLVRSLARNQVFHRFDLLSTVSGGGYVGAMIGRLFHQAQPASGETKAEAVEAALGDADRRWFAWWLRANGRYLVPHGTKDAFFAAATFGRNFVAVHIELALLCILLGLALVGIDLGAWQAVDGWSRDTAGRSAVEAQALLWLTGWPTVWLLLPVVAAFSAIAAAVYWNFPADAERTIPGWRWFAVALAAAGLYVIATAWPWLREELQLPLPVLLTVVALDVMFIFGAAIALVLLLAVGAHGRVRNRLTATLGLLLRIAVGIFVAGALDYYAWQLALGGGGLQGRVAVGIAVAGVVLRAVLPKVAELPRNFPPLVRHAIGALLNVAGLMVLAGLVIFWISVVHGQVTQRLFSLAEQTTAAEPAFRLAWLAWSAVLVPALLMFFVSASNAAFLNKSSLYAFYKARLVRGYLGATNPQRLGGGVDPLGVVPEVRSARPVSVNTFQADDDMPLADYAPHASGGPVHLINACANQTRDPRGGLFNQDRKGLPVTVGAQHLRIGAGGWESLGGENALTLGSWMAISGAAVSPGLGGATRPGISALAMMAGLRLGYWWERQEGRDKWSAFGKYGLLVNELLGRFDIAGIRPWFLSDGGHFENTAAYALLRERCELIVLADCGADPRYAFGDIENLVRKARIDLQADISFLKPKPPLERGWESFGSLSDIASAESSASLALAHIDYGAGKNPGYLVVVKPSMRAGLPVDLVNFKADNPAFPQEPTADQFFDESQWESYFRLGTILGEGITPALLQSVGDVAARCFEIDDGALTHADGKHPAGPAAAAAASAAAAPVKRLPARIVATGAVTTSISIGAIASLGVTAYQAINSEAKEREAAEKRDPAETKELSKLYAELLAAKAGERGKPTVNLVVALAGLADRVCDKPSAKGYQANPYLQAMLREARASCEADPQIAGICLDTLDAAACLKQQPRARCIAQYWIRDYEHDALNCRPQEQLEAIREREKAQTAADKALAPAAPASAAPQVVASAPAPTTVTAPPAGPIVQQRGSGDDRGVRTAAEAAGSMPVASAPAAAQAASDACKGKTIYIQIYGPDQREVARTLRARWTELGAKVPGVEDVTQSARQAQRQPPLPVGAPTVIQHQPELQACASEIVASGKAASTAYATSNWVIRELPLRLKATQDLLEVWLPPVVGR